MSKVIDGQQSISGDKLVVNSAGFNPIYTYLRNVEGDWVKVHELQTVGNKPVGWGKHIAILSDHGNKLVIGANKENQSAGAVHTYIWNNETSAWDEINVLLNEYDGEHGLFGVSLAISDNGEKLVVGARGEDNNHGAVYTYEWDNNGNWVFTNKLVCYDDILFFECFGSSCAMSNDGNKLVVGADWINDFTGKVYTYLWNSRTEAWDKVDAMSSKNIEADTFFGSKCTLTNDGNNLCVKTISNKITCKFYNYLWNYGNLGWDEVDLPVGDDEKGE